jgi:hypothetical protein
MIISYQAKLRVYVLEYTSDKGGLIRLFVVVRIDQLYAKICGVIHFIISFQIHGPDLYAQCAIWQGGQNNFIWLH